MEGQIKVKTKVLFIIHDLKHGGAEKVLLNLVSHMDRAMFDITIMTIFDVGVHKASLPDDVHYKTIFKREFRGNKYFFRLFSPEYLYQRYVKDHYDVVIAYLEGSTTRIAAGCTEPGVRKLAWRHITESPKEFVQCHRSMKEAREIYQRFDAVACVSKTVAKNFKHLSGMDSDKIRVIYNTNETDKILALSEEEVANAAFDGDHLKLIAVGKVMPRKGFMRLAYVHKRLQQEGYRYKIYILGQGEQQKEIEKYLKTNQLQDSFVFLGYDTNPYKYVRRSDLFICPSYAEGFSTAATEALIVGTPVLTTLCSGMEEMLGKNGEYGVIVENSTKGIYKGLKRFLDHPELLEHYTEQAELRGKAFSTKKTVKKTERFILYK